MHIVSSRSVERHHCGISVPLWDHRQYPLAFWQEALKQLMHSMSMSLVRERSVATFMERINRLCKSKANPAEDIIVPGWIELRKGFNVYIDDRNNLCILVPGVLKPSGSALDRSSGGSSAAAQNAPPIVFVESLDARLPGASPGVELVEVLSLGDIDDCGVSTDTLKEFKSVAAVASAFTIPRMIRWKGDLANYSTSGETLMLFHFNGSVAARLGTVYLSDAREAASASGEQQLSWSSDSRGVYSRIPNSAGRYNLCVDIGRWIIYITVVPLMSSTVFEEPPEELYASISETADSKHSDYVSDGDEGDIWRDASGVASRRNSHDEDLVADDIPFLPPKLQNIYDLLRGRFSYDFNIYSRHCVSTTEFGQSNEKNSPFSNYAIPLKLCNGLSTADTRFSFASTFPRDIDPKIREGIPLVWPAEQLDADKKKINIPKESSLARVFVTCEARGVST